METKHKKVSVLKNENLQKDFASSLRPLGTTHSAWPQERQKSPGILGPPSPGCPPGCLPRLWGGKSGWDRVRGGKSEGCRVGVGRARGAGPGWEARAGQGPASPLASPPACRVALGPPSWRLAFSDSGQQGLGRLGQGCSGAPVRFPAASCGAPARRPADPQTPQTRGDRLQVVSYVALGNLPPLCGWASRLLPSGPFWTLPLDVDASPSPLGKRYSTGSV